MYRGRAVAATCTETGIKDHYVCIDCGKYFEDAKATKELSEEELVIPAHGHDLELVEAVEPTEATNGSQAFYVCNRCGNWYKDADATEEIENMDDIILEKQHPDGLANVSEDGNWYYYKDNKIDTGFSGIAPNANGWWKVDSGKVNFDFNGLAWNENGCWYLVNGKVAFDHNGSVNVNGRNYTIREGKVVR